MASLGRPVPQVVAAERDQHTHVPRAQFHRLQGLDGLTDVTDRGGRGGEAEPHARVLRGEREGLSVKLLGLLKLPLAELEGGESGKTSPVLWIRSERRPVRPLGIRGLAELDERLRPDRREIGGDPALALRGLVGEGQRLLRLAQPEPREGAEIEAQPALRRLGEDPLALALDFLPQPQLDLHPSEFARHLDGIGRELLWRA